MARRRCTRPCTARQVPIIKALVAAGAKLDDDEQGQPDAAAAGREAGAAGARRGNNNDPNLVRAEAEHARGSDRC